jgi:flagellar biosynthesis protein FlhF
MQVKTYRESTVRGALRVIREDLGPDALVLATELVAARGWRGWMGMREVKVTAAPPADRPGRLAVAGGRPTDTPSRAIEPTRSGLVARLLASGLDRAMAERVAEAATPAQCRAATLPVLRRLLASQLGAIAAGEETYARVEVFIGPPGVGKTTTIAKIAAQERARRGRTLGLVGADGFRAGAVEQLRTYASIIGSPFRIARSLEELDKALEAGRHALLVDTAGRSPNDEALRDLRRLLGSRRGVRTHLVLAADTSVRTAGRVLEAYADLRPDRIVISKVDEAETMGPLLGLLAERGVPVSYLTTGQRVPEDLDRATPAALAGALLRDGDAALAVC